MASMAMTMASINGGMRASRCVRGVGMWDSRRLSLRRSRMWDSRELKWDFRGLSRMNSVIMAKKQEEEDAEEDEDEQADNQDEEQQEEQKPMGNRDILRELMKEKIKRQQKDPDELTPEEQYYDTFVKLEPFFEDEEPSEGMKQLLAMVQASPAFQELPPPKYQIPRWIQEVGIVAAVWAVCFVVAHVNAVLDERWERKLLEKRAERAEKRKNQKPNELQKRVNQIIQVSVQYIEYWLQSFKFWLQNLWINILVKFKERFS